MDHSAFWILKNTNTYTYLNEHGTHLDIDVKFSLLTQKNHRQQNKNRSVKTRLKIFVLVYFNRFRELLLLRIASTWEKQSTKKLGAMDGGKLRMRKFHMQIMYYLIQF